MVLQLNQREERDLSDGATFLADTKRVERERRVSAKNAFGAQVSPLFWKFKK
jgi:hypothetical protein